MVRQGKRYNSGETNSHSQKLQGCGKGRTKINQFPAGGQEVIMRRNVDVAGQCNYVLSLLNKKNK